MGRPIKSNISRALADELKLVSRNIRSIRKAKDLSQSELAKASGISVTTLNEIESKASRDIRVSTLVSIAEALDISLVELFLSEGSRSSESDMEQLLQVSKTLNRLLKKRNNK